MSRLWPLLTLKDARKGPFTAICQRQPRSVLSVENPTKEKFSVSHMTTLRSDRQYMITYIVRRLAGFARTSDGASLNRPIEAPKPLMAGLLW